MAVTSNRFCAKWPSRSHTKPDRLVMADARLDRRQAQARKHGEDAAFLVCVADSHALTSSDKEVR